MIQSFNTLLTNAPVAMETLLGEVDAYCSLLSNLATRVSTIFVPTWSIPPYNRGLGMVDSYQGGLRHALQRMNLRLAENLQQHNGLYVLESERWLDLAGRNAFNPKLWYLGKVLFSNEVFREAAEDIKAALRGIYGGARKLVVVDLDETMWGGIVGDVGWQGLKLGGHDAEGEAYVDFQLALKALKNRGILLAIVSKNDEATALDAIEQHPEMILRKKDFVGWRINWEDKARNISDLVRSLNLGLQSVVFIDDNPLERGRVREALPEVLVPEWPPDAMLYKSTLLSLRCFDSPALSNEDKQRSEMYAAEKQREDLKASVQSYDGWLETLDLTVTVEEFSQSNQQRIAQLLNKTNQMNLSTRRLSEAELSEWVNQPHRRLWGLRVSDRFGDSGLTGILSVETSRKEARIVDFVLSCRVMGRKVEETMVSIAVAHALRAGAEHVLAEFIPTEKNKPCLEFWKRSGFMCENDSSTFTWNPQEPYLTPAHIRLVHTSEAD
jgi:FkbH-like protein